MYVHIRKRISEISEDDDIYRLLQEIEIVTKFSLSPFRNNGPSQVIHYLTEYRKRRPIDKTGINTYPLPKELLLTKKISKLNGSNVYELCRELAALKGESIENCGGNTLYVFLDRYLKDGKKKKEKYLPGDMYF